MAIPAMNEIPAINDGNCRVFLVSSEWFQPPSLKAESYDGDGGLLIFDDVQT